MPAYMLLCPHDHDLLGRFAAAGKPTTLRALFEGLAPEWARNALASICVLGCVGEVGSRANRELGLVDRLFVVTPLGRESLKHPADTRPPVGQWTAAERAAARGRGSGRRNRDE